MAIGDDYVEDERPTLPGGASSDNAAVRWTEIDIAFLCQSSVAVWVRHPDTDLLVQLKSDGTPVRLQKKLGEILGLDPEGDGRDMKTILMYLFKGNDVAIGAMAVKVAEWIANTSREVEDALLGE
jgi:hypothetical protein